MDFKLTYSRLNGQHVLGPGVFWSTFGFSLLAHALGSSDLVGGNFLTRFISVGVAHLAMMAMVFLTRFLTSRLKPGKTALALVVFGYVIAGAVRGLTLQICLFEFEVADTAFSIYRLVGGVVVMSSCLIWVALAFGLKAEWGAKRAELRASKRQLEALLIDSEARLESEASDTLSTIESMLQTALLPELMLSPQKALTRLQSLINDTLRPLSASLAQNLPKPELVRLNPTASRFRWRTLITHLKLKESSRPVTTATILSILAINGFVKYIPNVNPVVLLGLSLVTIAGALGFARFVLARFVDELKPAIRVPLVLAILFTIGFGSGMLVLSLAADSSVAYPLSVNGGVAATLVAALFGIDHAATKEMLSIERQLKNYERQLRWTIAALNCQHWLQKKQFARKIHGPIQSEVAAAAIRIERSLSSGEVTQSGEEALQSLRDRLARLLNDTKGTAEVRPVLDEIAETWQGLCEIEFVLSESDECTLRNDSICVETVLEIAREACSNAIRHGSAEHIRIEIDFAASDLVKIQVWNDGTKLELGANRGVGSAYLDDCTFSHDLSMAASGTILTATVPFREK